MASSLQNEVFVNIHLRNGTDNNGNLKTVLITLGSLNTDTFNANKAMSIVRWVSPCLNKFIAFTRKVHQNTISTL